MIVGKMKYLSLLGFSTTFEKERLLIMKPLIKTYNEIKLNASGELEEYARRLKSEEEKVIDDETGMTSHDWLEDQIEDIAYEFQLQNIAVASSLVLLAQSYLHSQFQKIVSAYDYFKEPYRMEELRRVYFDLGERVDGVAWAESVKAASNYVRHIDEWNVSSRKMERTSAGELFVRTITDLISQLDKKQQNTAKTLVGLGFREEDIFDKNKNIVPEIIKKLKLHEPEEFSRCAFVWLQAVMQELHKKFDSRDPMPKP